MQVALSESDALIDELIPADILVIETPLYNFGMPVALKAWVDQIIRPGRTIEIDESNPAEPYIAKLADRPRHAVVLTPRDGIGFSPGGDVLAESVANAMREIDARGLSLSGQFRYALGFAKPRTLPTLE